MKRILQFITNGETVNDIVDQVRRVLEGGCKWIQLRMKDFDDKEIISAIEQIKPMCATHQATLIMNDRVDLAKIYNLDGVHLGREDMCIPEARQILGDNAIIGATANTFEEVLELSQQSVNYFGIGPMRYTDTKKNLRPFIGLTGYHDIVESMRQTDITKPAVAIGGITNDDVYDLLDTGLWGVAVSSAIAKATDITQATAKIMKIVNEFPEI